MSEQYVYTTACGIALYDNTSNIEGMGYLTLRKDNYTFATIYYANSMPPNREQAGSIAAKIADDVVALQKSGKPTNPRRKVPANGKPKREKKVSPYTQAALAWWRVDGSWFVDASLCTKREHAKQLGELLRRRALNRFEVQGELVYTEGVDASVLLHELRNAVITGEWPERFSMVEDLAAFTLHAEKLALWLLLAQDGKADLHFLTWVEKGCLMSARLT